MNRLDRCQLSVHASKLATELKGISRKTEGGMPKFVNLECPVCKSTKCCGLLPTKNKDNYRLVCLRDSCGLNSISLNMAMEEYASEMTKSEWRDALGWRPKNEWHGIKHRRPRGKSQKSDATSFRESQQQKQTLQNLRIKQELQRQTYDHHDH